MSPASWRRPCRLGIDPRAAGRGRRRLSPPAACFRPIRTRCSTPWRRGSCSMSPICCWVAAIDIAGLAVAFPVGIGLALVVGVCPQLPPGAARPAVAAVRRRGAGCWRPSWSTRSPITRQRGDAEKRDTGRGLKLALACGVLMGSFYPLVTKATEGPAGLGPYAVAFVFALGVLICAVPPQYVHPDAPAAHGRRTGEFRSVSPVAPLPSMAGAWPGGLIWGTGRCLLLRRGACGPGRAGGVLCDRPGRHHDLGGLGGFRLA